MRREKKGSVTEPSRAVFLSYTSQDAEAARCICAPLRAAGVEVWLDQSELRGGDAWDRQIRKQIQDCALFLPIISANTQARLEGYFRLEWRLAVERTHLMSDRVAFLVPVVIDDTREQNADVPDAFRGVQWTRLPAGETSPAFIERVSRLLSGQESPDRTRPSFGGASSPVRSAPSPTSRWKQPAMLLVATLGVMGAGYLAVDKFWPPKHAAVPATAPLAQSALPVQSAIPEKSIAVLPFVDMSEQHDQGYFSDGLSEELINLLTKVPELRVPARTSSFYFKGKSDDIATIAQRLRVANVLEGSVRRSGTTLRVTAQLIRADNGYHLWSETYDRKLKDIFEIQDEIASAVVVALKIRLAALSETSRQRTSNIDAYNEYLLGRQVVNRGEVGELQQSIDAFKRAIALDPDYAAAYAGLAVSEATRADMMGEDAGLERARTAADKAIALAPTEADGYAARGFLRFVFDWDWAGARVDFEKALSLDPSDSDAQRNYGNLLRTLGSPTAGIAAIRKALEVDPLAARSWAALADSLTFVGDHAGAHEALRRGLEINPESAYILETLAILQLLESKFPEALENFSKTKFDGFRLPGTAMAEHSLGHAGESRRALDESVAKVAKESAYQIAEAFAWCGESDKAFEWLDRAYRQRDGGLTSINTDPLLASLHAHPRFKPFLRKMNLSG